MSRFVSMIAVAIFVPAALACHVDNLGSGAPGPLIGPYTAIPFAPDPQPVFADVTSVQDGTGRSINFSIPMSHRKIGQGWGSWSHGYTGDVYYTNGAAALTITMNPPQPGFRFYAESNPFGLFDFTVTAKGSGGEVQSSTQTIEGLSGAGGFACYCDPGSLVTSVDIAAPVDFAVGEFSKGIPEPSTLGLLSLGLIGLLRRR
jgi:hypothetical protein